MRHLFLPLTLVTVLLGAWWALPDATRQAGLAPRTATVPSAEGGAAAVLEAPSMSTPGAHRVGGSDVVPAPARGTPRAIPNASHALTFGDQGRIPDPIQTGECALLLHIVERKSGEAVASTVTLWRLDAPASEHWKRGDQAQYSKEIPAEGGSFENLATGTYRAVCHAERDDAPDHQAFRVGGSLTEVTLELASPVGRSARALLYDEDGTPIRQVEMRGGSHSWTSRVVGPREWVHERAPLVPRTKPANHHSGGGAGGSFSWHGHSNWSPATANEQGFELGSFEGNLRDRDQTHRIELRLTDGRKAEVSIHGAHRGKRLYLSVFPRRGPVLASLELSNGGTGRDISDEITIVGRELLASEALTDAPWLEVPIGVYVHHPNYEHVSFTYKLGDGPLKLRRLKFLEK